MNKQQILAMADRDRPPATIDPAERASSLSALLNTYPIEHRPTVHWIVNRFPIAFAPENERIRPLKIGVHLDILAIASNEADWLDPNILSLVIRQWVSAPAYRFAIRQGKRRRDLQGMRCATISPAERAFAKPTVKRTKSISDEVITQRMEYLRNISIQSQTDRKNTASDVDEFREILRCLPNNHPSCEELTGQLLRLIEARRRVKRRLHVDLFTCAHQVLRPETFARVDAFAKLHGDDAASAALSNEHEQISRTLDTNELMLIRGRLSNDDRQRLVQERQALDQELSRITNLIEATPSVATAFVKATYTMLSPDERKPIRA